MKEVAVGGEYKLSLCRPKFPALNRVPTVRFRSGAKRVTAECGLGFRFTCTQPVKHMPDNFKRIAFEFTIYGNGH